MSAGRVRRFALAALGFWLTALALFARGGGGCLAEGTRIATPDGERAIETLRTGDVVWSFQDGRCVPARVAAVFSVQPDEFVALEVSDGGSLLATVEHPIALRGAATFQRADSLSASAALLGFPSGNERVPSPASGVAPRSGTAVAAHALGTIPLSLRAAQREPAAGRRAFNLLVTPGGVFFANGVLVHNKGCFLPDTPVLLADGSRRAIAAVRVGDVVLAFDSTGGAQHEGEETETAARAVPVRVVAVYTHQVSQYLVVRTEHAELRVTDEHPFYVGAGTFRTIGALHVGDTVWAHDGAGALVPQRLLALERVEADVTVYNLQTDEPHTYFADGIAVHNKGGGCFAAGTTIATPSGPRAIETLQLGDRVFAPDANGARVAAEVRGVFLNFAPLRVLHTERGTLRTTDEHPLLGAGGEFLRADAFALGAALQTEAGPAAVLAIERGTEVVPVYTLSVGAPHTFLADGFVVHNKGGGSRSRSSSSRSRSSGRGGDGSPLAILFPFVLVIVLIVIVRQKKGGARLLSGQRELDHSFSRAQIDGKAYKTRALVEFISRTDATWTPDALIEVARETFTTLQRCWSGRAYDEMKPRMMPDLHAQHCAQLDGMRRTHEINVIENLRVESVDLVHVNYREKAEERSFTVLITASARDYYIDDRTRAFVRGDGSAKRFQEFWTFHWFEQSWRLREIEQTQESAALTTENFFAPFTDTGRDQVYGDHAGQTGAAGPMLPAAVHDKDDKIERLLNFLVQTDRIWNREGMLGVARRTYLQTLLAWQDGRAEAFAGMELSAAALARLRGVNEANQRNGWRLEYRNLCIRKVELVHVDNHDDRTRDNFTARISAHAQRVVLRGGSVVHRDADVCAWVESVTFRRVDARWVLDEILPDAVGASAVARENFDEGTGQQMLEWYYSKSRAA